MNTRSKVALYIAGALALVLLVLALVPLLFRDRLEARVKAEVASSLNADVDWSRVGVSLLRDFPNLTLRLDDLTVTGVGPFQGDTLAAVPGFRLVLDLGSVVRSLRGGDAIILRDVELRAPDVRLVVLEDGAANWDIARATEAVPAADPARAFDVSLRRFEIIDGRLTMDDRQSGLAASMTGLRQTLSGDFRRTDFTVRSHTMSDAVSLRFAGVPYLSQARLDVRADLDVDGRAGTVTIRDNAIRLNDLVLHASGSVGMADDSMALDVAFNAPSTDFGDILSLVPAVYAREFGTLRTTGAMSVAGWVRGGYGPDAFPALAIEAKVENGTLRYPDLPLPARDIFVDLSLTNPGGALDNMVVDVRRFHVVMGSDPIEGRFVMRQPVSDPDIDLRLAGRLDLADLGRTFKLGEVDELAGVVMADAAMRARMSDLDGRRYDRVTAEGGFTVAGVLLQTIDLPHPMRVDEARLRLSPSHAELASFQATIGSTDLAMTGRLDNLLGFVLRDEELRGEARVTSRFLDLDEWRSDDELEAVVVPGNIDFALDGTVDRVKLGTLDMRNVRGGVRVKDRRATLEDLRMDMLGGALAVSGFYETADPARPTFDVDLRLAEMDVPSTFAGLGTVRAFAPVARYAQGRVSAEVRLAGALTEDMTPVLDALSGQGAFRTAGLMLHDFPALDHLAEMLHVPQLRDPGLADVASTFEIRDGRLHVRPFDVRVGDLTMNVSGSNGIDQSLLYSLGLELPRAALGADANRMVTSLISQAGRTGLTLQASDTIRLGARLAGTITNPAIVTDFQGVTRSAAAGAQQALRDEAGRRAEDVEERLDVAAEEARLRAREESARLVADAERRAATIREEARSLAETVRTEGYQQADAIVARASGPVARAAAQTAADRLRRETDERANRIVEEADTRADALVAEARERAGTTHEP